MGSPETDDLAAQLVDLLRWYGEMGVDAAVDDVPHDRFAAAAAAAVRTPMPEAEPQRPSPAMAPSAGRPPLPGRGTTPPPAAPRALEAGALSAEAAVVSAREAAARASSLDELRALLDVFEGCGLKRTANKLVFADGNPAARIMLVGEAPGAEEDRSGLPFVGRGGRLLDRMLAAIGLDRTQIYIANVVPWRPPGNRDPTPQEVATCLPFIQRQIALCDPDLLLLMGNAALKALVSNKAGITKARGRWIDFDTGRRTIKALPMLHPAYLLRQPAQKKFAWRDWRTLQRGLTDAGQPARQPGPESE